MKQFLTTNPNWIRRPKSSETLISVPTWQVWPGFHNTALTFLQRLQSAKHLSKPTGHTRLIVASADSIPLDSNSIDAVLISPPYCTRIDYAVALQPELALMGFRFDRDYRALRDSTLGSSTVSQSARPTPRAAWGPTCNTIIQSIYVHASKASSTYYLKTILQYFDQLYRSDYFHAAKSETYCCRNLLSLASAAVHRLHVW